MSIHDNDYNEWVHDSPYGHLHLRDLFAAFALQAVIGLNLEDSTHESDATYAYAAADAMLAQRQEKASETSTQS